MLHSTKGIHSTCLTRQNFLIVNIETNELHYFSPRILSRETDVVTKKSLDNVQIMQLQHYRGY